MCCWFPGVVPEPADEGQEAEDDSGVAVRRPHPRRLRPPGGRRLGQPPLPGNLRGGGSGIGRGRLFSAGHGSTAATATATRSADHVHAR